MKRNGQRHSSWYQAFIRTWMQLQIFNNAIIAIRYDASNTLIIFYQKTFVQEFVTALLQQSYL